MYECMRLSRDTKEKLTGTSDFPVTLKLNRFKFFKVTEQILASVHGAEPPHGGSQLSSLCSITFSLSMLHYSLL